MHFVELLRTAQTGDGRIYLKTTDGTEFHGTVKTVGSDCLQIETEKGRVYTVLLAQVLFAAL
jgi:hypothetical protein